MSVKIPLFFWILAFLLRSFTAFAKEQPEIPPAVVEKLQQLKNGELNQIEKIKLADQLQHAGAKAEALALYEENLPIDRINPAFPPEAYLNYGTALLEKGDEQKGLDVYDNLAESLDPKNPKSQKIKEILEKNVVNYFQVQEQKKKEEKEDKKDKKDENENKENKDKDNKQGGSGSKQDEKDQKGQEQKDQQGKQGQGDPSKDKQDKKDGKGEEKEKDKESDDKDKDDENKDKDKDKEGKDKSESGKDGEGKKEPPSKMSPKLKQLMSDDRQLQLKVIEQGTRDMNRRQNRANKDW